MIRRTFSDDSLIATSFGSSASSTNISGVMSTRVRHRVVVDHDRQAGRPGDGAEVGDRLARVGLVDHRRQDHQAVDADLLGIGGEPAGQRRRVLGDPAQAPALARRRASTVARRTSSFSAYSSEQFSPTVPSMISP